MKKNILFLLLMLLGGNPVCGMKRKRPFHDDSGEEQKRRKVENKSESILDSIDNEEDFLTFLSLVNIVYDEGSGDESDDDVDPSKRHYCPDCEYSSSRKHKLKKHRNKTCPKKKKKSFAKKPTEGDDFLEGLSLDLDDLGDLHLDDLGDLPGNDGSDFGTFSFLDPLDSRADKSPLERIDVPITYQEDIAGFDRMADVRVYTNLEEDGESTGDNRQIAVGRSQEFSRNVNFQLSILPSLTQSLGSLDCAFYALFNGACYDPTHAVLKENREEFEKLLTRWKKRLGGKYMDTTNLQSREMQEIMQSDRFFQSLLNQDGSLRANVSIVDNLGRLEVAFRQSVWDEYRVTLDDKDSIHADAERIRNGKEPQVIRLFECHETWRHVPSILQNIRRFRQTGATQTIILNRGGHWITLRLFRKNNQDHIEVSDSLYNDRFGFNDLSGVVRRVYHMFRTDPLPVPIDLPPADDLLEEFLEI